jgi:hypothetical protein
MPIVDVGIVGAFERRPGKPKNAKAFARAGVHDGWRQVPFIRKVTRQWCLATLRVLARCEAIHDLPSFRMLRNIRIRLNALKRVLHGSGL